MHNTVTSQQDGPGLDFKVSRVKFSILTWYACLCHCYCFVDLQRWVLPVIHHLRSKILLMLKFYMSLDVHNEMSVLFFNLYLCTFVLMLLTRKSHITTMHLLCTYYVLTTHNSLQCYGLEQDLVTYFVKKKRSVTAYKEPKSQMQLEGGENSNMLWYAAPFMCSINSIVMLAGQITASPVPQYCLQTSNIMWSCSSLHTSLLVCWFWDHTHNPSFLKHNELHYGQHGCSCLPNSDVNIKKWFRYFLNVLWKHNIVKQYNK